MKFEKITINFIHNNVKTLSLTCVSLCVQLVLIIMPISSKELKAHEIFNRSHLNSKLRLGPVFFHSSPSLHFAYTIYLTKNMFDIQGQKYKLHSYHVIQLCLCLQLLSTVFLGCIHFTKHLSAYTKLSWL